MNSDKVLRIFIHEDLSAAERVILLARFRIGSELKPAKRFPNILRTEEDVPAQIEQLGTSSAASSRTKVLAEIGKGRWLVFFAGSQIMVLYPDEQQRVRSSDQHTEPRSRRMALLALFGLRSGFHKPPAWTEPARPKA